jgi:uncharacterized protein (DUF3084 family)
MEQEKERTSIMPKIKSPLAMAMMIPEPDEKRREIPVPRFFTFKFSEIGKDVKPGDSFQVSVRGFVKSVDDEGNVTANIVSVNDNMPLTEEREDEEIRVRTQESHTP